MNKKSILIIPNQVKKKVKKILDNIVYYWKIIRTKKVNWYKKKEKKNPQKVRREKNENMQRGSKGNK